MVQWVTQFCHICISLLTYIGGEYVQVGSDPGSDEIKVDLNEHEDAPDGLQEYSLRYTIKSDPTAPLELVDNV